MAKFFGQVCQKLITKMWDYFLHFLRNFLTTQSVSQYSAVISQMFDIYVNLCFWFIEPKFLPTGTVQSALLKVPKREIFDRSDFPDFYIMKSLRVGDFGVKIKKILKNVGVHLGVQSSLRVCSVYF